MAVLVAAVALANAGSVSASTNPQVAGLQVALRAHGLYLGEIDGIAGPRTAAGVRAFQRRQGLSVDGIAGRSTRLALGRLGRPLFGKRLLRRGMVGWDVSVLQFTLTWKRFPTGIVDGYFGAETARALRRFQRAAGLVADGIAGPATAKALFTQRVRPKVRRARPVARASRYTVRPGDSLSAIAARFETTVPALARANRLDPGRYLIIGTRLRVPASAAGGASPVRELVDRWAAHYGIDGRLARALAWQESGFQVDLTSNAGAWGVMQVTPATWDFVETVLLGERVPRTAEGNVRVGLAYLRHLLESFGDERLAIAAYHQGARAVRKRGLFEETKLFVANVLALKSRM